jgi:ribose transport system substrate-binding protein
VLKISENRGRAIRNLGLPALLVVAALLWTLASAGCAEAEASKGVFGVSDPYSENPIVQQINKLIEQRAKERGYTVLFDGTQGGSVEGQQATLDSWIAQKVKAINVYAPNPDALIASARRAKEAGIIFTAETIPVKGEDGVCDFGDSRLAPLVGAATVKWINENNPQAEVLILGDSNNKGNLIRTELPAKMIGEQTKAKIVGQQDAVTVQTGFDMTTTMLQAHPNASVVVALADEAGLGAARAFKLAGKDPAKSYIISYSGSKAALEALQKDDPKEFLKADAVVDLQEFANDCVDAMADLVEKGVPASGELKLVSTPHLVTSKEQDELKHLINILDTK